MEVLRIDEKMISTPVVILFLVKYLGSAAIHASAGGLEAVAGVDGVAAAATESGSRESLPRGYGVEAPTRGVERWGLQASSPGEFRRSREVGRAPERREGPARRRALEGGGMRVVTAAQRNPFGLSELCEDDVRPILENSQVFQAAKAKTGGALCVNYDSLLGSSDACRDQLCILTDAMAQSQLSDSSNRCVKDLCALYKGREQDFHTLCQQPLFNLFMLRGLDFGAVFDSCTLESSSNGSSDPSANQPAVGAEDNQQSGGQGSSGEVDSGSPSSEIAEDSTSSVGNKEDAEGTATREHDDSVSEGISSLLIPALSEAERAYDVTHISSRTCSPILDLSGTECVKHLSNWNCYDDLGDQCRWKNGLSNTWEANGSNVVSSLDADSRCAALTRLKLTSPKMCCESCRECQDAQQGCLARYVLPFGCDESLGAACRLILPEEQRAACSALDATLVKQSCCSTCEPSLHNFFTHECFQHVNIRRARSPEWKRVQDEFTDLNCKLDAARALVDELDAQPAECRDNLCNMWFLQYAPACGCLGSVNALANVLAERCNLQISSSEADLQARCRPDASIVGQVRHRKVFVEEVLHSIPVYSETSDPGSRTGGAADGISMNATSVGEDGNPGDGVSGTSSGAAKVSSTAFIFALKKRYSSLFGLYSTKYFRITNFRESAREEAYAVTYDLEIGPATPGFLAELVHPWVSQAVEWVSRGEYRNMEVTGLAFPRLEPDYLVCRNPEDRNDSMTLD